MHTPVLLHEIVAALAVKAGEIFLDCTLGSGGHSEAIARAVGGPFTLIGIDEDGAALERARARLKHTSAQVCLWQGNFRHLERALAQCGAEHPDAILFDLGVSTEELLAGGRGFSFSKNEPLRMTFNTEGGVHARDAVNEWSEENLAAIFSGFGDERYAERIARAIAQRRAVEPIETTGQLAEIVSAVVPRRGKIHPATRIFQALRIAVNDELGALNEALPKAISALNPDGRIAVISYHSGEDRIVKKIFHTKPIHPSRTEVLRNSRARSAQLRIFIKK